MTDFTPGPWTAGCIINSDTTCECRYIFSEAYFGSIAKISVDNGKRVGEGGNDSPELDDAIANAHLIAAAPEMYEALKDVKEAFIKRSGMVDAVEVAIAALAKAEGKT